jgi:hypothetical protein
MNKQTRNKQTKNPSKQTNKNPQVQKQQNFSLSLSSGVTPPASSPDIGI